MKKREAFLAGILTATILSAVVVLIAYGIYTTPVLQDTTVNGTYKVDVYRVPDGRIDVSSLLIVLVTQLLVNIVALVIGYMSIED